MLGSRPLSRTTAFAPRRDLKREKPFHQERRALFVASPKHTQTPHLLNIVPVPVPLSVPDPPRGFSPRDRADASDARAAYGCRMRRIGPLLGRKTTTQRIRSHLLSGEALHQAARVEAFDSIRIPTFTNIDAPVPRGVARSGRRRRASRGRGPRPGSAPGSWPGSRRRSHRQTPALAPGRARGMGRGKRSSDQTGPRGTAPGPCSLPVTR